MRGLCRSCLSTISSSPWEAGNEQPDGAVAGGDDQSTVQNSTNADGRLAVRNAGGAGDSREAEPYRISRSTTVGRDRRARQRGPGEPVLLQLKAEAEAKQREQAAVKLVEKTTLDVYSLLAISPHQALTAVHQALEQMPEEPRLIALEEKVVEQEI